MNKKSRIIPKILQSLTDCWRKMIILCQHVWPSGQKSQKYSQLLKIIKEKNQIYSKNPTYQYPDWLNVGKVLVTPLTKKAQASLLCLKKLSCFLLTFFNLFPVYRNVEHKAVFLQPFTWIWTKPTAKSPHQNANYNKW